MTCKKSDVTLRTGRDQVSLFIIVAFQQCHPESLRARDAQQMARNRGSIPRRHSRAGGNPVFTPGFRVAASGLARNDGLVVFVIPAKAGIQEVWCGLGILFLSSLSTALRINSVKDLSGKEILRPMASE